MSIQHNHHFKNYYIFAKFPQDNSHMNRQISQIHHLSNNSNPNEWSTSETVNSITLIVLLILIHPPPPKFFFSFWKTSKWMKTPNFPSSQIRQIWLKHLKKTIFFNWELVSPIGFMGWVQSPKRDEADGSSSPLCGWVRGFLLPFPPLLFPKYKRERGGGGGGIQRVSEMKQGNLAWTQRRSRKHSTEACPDRDRLRARHRSRIDLLPWQYSDLEAK